MNSIPLHPEQASNFAQEMDLLYLLLVGLTVFFSLLVFVPLIYFVAKYRVGTRANRKNPHHHHLKLELAWTIIPLLMGVPVFYWAAKLYVDMYTPTNDPNALEIRIVGKQWMWHLQHPTGQRENNELHVPLGRPIKLVMISQDVLHAFYVPAFRIKRDVLPGRYEEQWFIPTKVGRYHLFCAEYCGTKHSEMTGTVTVMEPADYEKWLRDVRWGIGNLKATAETMEQQGEKLFVEFGCNSCHDPSRARKPVPLTGVYGRGRTLKDGRVVVANEDYLRRSIYEPSSMIVAGYVDHEPMPSYKGTIDEQQVFQLIAYIRSLSQAEPKPKPESMTAPGGAPQTEAAR